jgi:hypothetical protein
MYQRWIRGQAVFPFAKFYTNVLIEIIVAHTYEVQYGALIHPYIVFECMGNCLSELKISSAADITLYLQHYLTSWTSS